MNNSQWFFHCMLQNTDQDCFLMLQLQKECWWWFVQYSYESWESIDTRISMYWGTDWCTLSFWWCYNSLVKRNWLFGLVCILEHILFKLRGHPKTNKIFPVPPGNQTIVKLRKSDSDCDISIDHFAIKTDFERVELLLNLSYLESIYARGWDEWELLVFYSNKIWNDTQYQLFTEKDKKIVIEERGKKGVVRRNNRKKMMNKKFWEKLRTRQWGAYKIKNIFLLLSVCVVLTTLFLQCWVQYIFCWHWKVCVQKHFCDLWATH